LRDPLVVYRASTAQIGGVFPFTFRAAPDMLSRVVRRDGARPRG